jgi:hypothetical protein
VNATRRLALCVPALLACACAGTAPRTPQIHAACGADPHFWRLLDAPPPNAPDLLSDLGEHEQQRVPGAHVATYWFDAPDGSQLYCEGVFREGQADTCLSLAIRRSPGGELTFERLTVCG